MNYCANSKDRVVQKFNWLHPKLPKKEQAISVFLDDMYWHYTVDCQCHNELSKVNSVKYLEKSY